MLEKSTTENLKDIYHFLTESINILICTLDISDNYKIIHVNDGVYKNILGYSKDNIIGVKFLNFIHPEDIKKTIRFLKRISKTANQLIEIRYKHLNNSYNWFEVKGKKLNNQELFLTLRDITKYKNIENNLRVFHEKAPEIQFLKFSTTKEYSDLFVASYNMLLTVLDNIPQYVFWKDRNLIYLGCNKNYADFLGLTNPEEIIGKSGNESQWEKETALLLEKKQKEVINKKKMDLRTEELLTLRDNNKRWFFINRVPLLNSSGENVGILVTYEDITEKKKYETLINELNVGFLKFSSDIKQNIRLLLKTALKLLNADLICYTSKHFLDSEEQYSIITSNDEEFMFNSEVFYKNIYLSEFFKQDHNMPQIYTYVNKTQYYSTDPFIKSHDIISSYGKLIKSKGEFIGCVCALYNKEPPISQQEQLVLYLVCDAVQIEQQRGQSIKKLEEQNVKLSEINKFKTDLLSRISHELKTPLLSIKGFTDILMSYHSSEFEGELFSILQEIKNGSNRLEDLIKNFLESASLEHGKIKINRSIEDLSELINEIMNELKGIIELRCQKVHLELQPNIVLNVDKILIKSAISNVLINAIKFTQPEGDISIKSKLEMDSVIITIIDNGIGFTEDEKNQIFKQFGKIERYGQGWDVDIGGSGLGLYNSMKILEMHGGKILLKSDGRNKGSKFVLSFPKKF